jgi:hypothetical protein
VRRRWPARIAALKELEHAALEALSNEALLARAERLLVELGEWWMEVTWFAAVGRTCAQLIGPLQIPGVTDPIALFLGNDNLLLDAARALRCAAGDPSCIQDYLARFGHAVESADPIHPTLRESSEHLAWQLAAARLDDLGPDERLGARSRRDEAAHAVQVAKGLRGHGAPGPGAPAIHSACLASQLGERSVLQAHACGVLAATFERGVRERNGKRVLVGSPGSAGRARGIARVVTGPEDFGRFQKVTCS